MHILYGANSCMLKLRTCTSLRDTCLLYLCTKLTLSTEHISFVFTYFYKMVFKSLCQFMKALCYILKYFVDTQMLYCLCYQKEQRHQNSVVSVGPHSEKFNIVSKDHGQTQKCDFLFQTGNTLFLKIWSKKPKCKFTLLKIWYLD